MYYLQSDLGLAFLLYFKCHTVGNSPDRHFSLLLFKYLGKCFFKKCTCLCLAMHWFRTLLIQVTISYIVFLWFYTVLWHIILFLMPAYTDERGLSSVTEVTNIWKFILSVLLRRTFGVVKSTQIGYISQCFWIAKYYKTKHFICCKVFKKQVPLKRN